MSHEFVMPGKVITGKGALQDAENEFQTAGKKALIVSGKVMERVGNVKVSSQIADYFDDHKLMCGLTYSGHPLACAAGITTLDVYKEEKLVERSKAMGKILGQIEEELKRKHHGRNYWGVKEKRILNLQPRKQYYCGTTIDHYRNRTS